MFKKIIETCIYSSDLEKLKEFYVNSIGLQFIFEEPGIHVFLKAGKSMLLKFNPNKTTNKDQHIFPNHGALTPPRSIRFELEL